MEEPRSKTIFRKQLYDRVWSIPMLSLAEEYGLSNVGLAKLCKRHDIPRPQRGYWAKKEVGLKVVATALPNPDKDYQITIAPYLTPVHDPELREKRDSMVKKIATEPDSITVPATLRGAHSLVSATLHVLEHAERDHDGILCRHKEACLDVSVSKSSLHRALCILDAVLKAFEAKDYQVRIIDATDADPSQTVVELLDVAVPFRIVESLEPRRVEKEPDGNLAGRYQFQHSTSFRSLMVPSGMLSLRIEHGYPHYYWQEEQNLRRTWGDGKKQRLEKCLAKFLAGVVVVATAKRAGKLREEEEKRQKIEAQKRAEETERQRATMWQQIEAEQSKVNRLLVDAARWERSKIIRDYLQAVKQGAMARGENIGDETEFGAWLKWASEQADRLDPLSTHPPSILDDKEKYRPPPPDRRNFRQW